MKTEILQIEQHDDILTILEKIEWCKSDRILLVFPNKMRELYQQVDLSRMTHVANNRGSLIAIVTSNRATQKAAIEIGIPVFASSLLAQKNDWGEVKRREFTSIKGYDAILHLKDNNYQEIKPIGIGQKSFVLIMITAAILALLVFLLPGVTVNIFPQTEKQTIALKITASTESNSPNINGLIPAYRGEIALSATKSKESTSSTQLPLTKAVGEVLLMNLGKEIVNIPAGTLLITDSEPGIKFVMKNETQVTPGDQGVSVQVEALEPGEAGNISPEQRLIFAGDLASQVSVESHSGFIGGLSTRVSTPSELDYQILQQSLITELTETAEKQINSKNTSMIPGSLALEKIIATEERYEVGKPSDKAELSITAKFIYLFYDPEDVEWIGTQLMDQSLSLSQISVIDTLVLTDLGDRNVSKDSATWNVHLEREVRNQVKTKDLQLRLRGMTLENGLIFLDNEIPHSRPAEITNRFFLWNWFPLFSERIILKVVYANKG